MANLLQLTPNPELTAPRPEPASAERDPCENCLEWLLDHDGAGSGLDADFLDGYDSTYFTDIEARLGFTPVNKMGDTMLGSLFLSGYPTEEMEAANKGYVDDSIATAIDGIDVGPVYPLTVYNEGVEIGEVKGLDFVGIGVSAAMDGAKAVVTIDGPDTPMPSGGPYVPKVLWSGPGSLIGIMRDGVEVMDASIINFVGDGIIDISEDGIETGQANIQIARAVRPDTINAFTAAQHIPWRNITFTYGVGGSGSGINLDFTLGNNVYQTINQSVEIPNPLNTNLDGLTVNMLLIPDTPSTRYVVLSGSKWMVAEGIPSSILIYNAILIGAIYHQSMDKWLVNYSMF